MYLLQLWTGVGGMKYCSECNLQLISLGFGYYFHPALHDHAKRRMPSTYQVCSLTETNFKLDKIHQDKKPVSRQLHLFDI